MQEFLDIIRAIIDNTPWFTCAYAVHKLCENKSKRMSIEIKDKIHIESER